MRIVGAAMVVLLVLLVGRSAADAARDKAEAYARAGAAALEARDFERAVGFFEKAAGEVPGDERFLRLLAAAVRTRGATHAKSGALRAAGQAALDARVYDKAIGYFEKALDDWPENEAAGHGLAEALRGQRATSRDHALELARMFTARGHWDTAQTHYLAALAADPDNREVRQELDRLLARRPLPGLRARIKAASDFLTEALPSWILVFVAGAVVTIANLVNRFRSRAAIEVVAFEGPDSVFKQGPGYGMAAIASSQLHAAGLALGHGTVVEPLAALSAKLTDTQAKLLGEMIAWFFPARGYRLEAVVHQFAEGAPPVAGTGRLGVTVKLVQLKFWVPRERVAATTTFWSIDQGPAHEALARLAAGWAEWHVTHP